MEFRSGCDLTRRGFLMAMGAACGLRGAGEPSLVQRLGYAADARVLILTADEFGECHASNLAIAKCMEAGLLKSTTFQAVGSWAPEAVEIMKKHPGMDVGVHLTLTTGAVSGMGLRPILPRKEVPGLCDAEGYLWPNGPEAWKHTNADEVKREGRAQIEKAIHMGIDPTHIDPHDGIAEDKGGEHMAEFMKVYGELAKEFSLPVRMPPTQAELAAMGQAGLRASIAKMGVVMADGGTASHGEMSYLRELFKKVGPGTVSEIYIHPAMEGPEVKAVRAKGDWWKVGIGDLALFTRDKAEVEKALKEEGIVVIGWREVRELQRRG